MKYKKNIEKVLTLILYLIYNILIYLTLINFKHIDYEKWINLAFYITISHIIITMISFKLININLFGISNIFILGSYIFHLGQIIIKGLNKNYSYNFEVSKIISSDIYIKSIIFSLITISMVSIGIMIANLIKKEVKEINYTINRDKYYGVVLTLGWTIIAISLPLELYFSLMKLIVSSKSGYLDVLEVESSGILSQLARFHLIGVGLLIMGYSYNYRKSNFILVLYIIYSIITMLSGSRIYQITSTIILVYITFTVTNQKISIYKTLKGIVILFIVAIFLNSLADIRAKGISDISVLIESLKYNFENNPIYNILEELGGTIYTVCLVILNVPSTIMYSKGAQFITSFATIFPNVNGIFTELNQYSNFVLSLDVAAIGGSYIAELYYSFKYIPYIIAIFIGFIVHKLSIKFDFYLKNFQFIKASYLIMPSFALILWIRGSYLGIVRNSIWGIIIIYFLVKYLIKDKKYRI